jgi:hypothetical protein
VRGIRVWKFTLTSPQLFSICNISCSFCVTSTQTSTTHHIILAAPDGSEHSENEMRLVSLDKDALTYLATVTHLGVFFFVHGMPRGTDGPK